MVSGSVVRQTPKKGGPPIARVQKGVLQGSPHLRMLLLFQAEGWMRAWEGAPKRPQILISSRLRARLSAALPHAHSLSYCIPVPSPLPITALRGIAQGNTPRCVAFGSHLIK